MQVTELFASSWCVLQKLPDTRERNSNFVLFGAEQLTIRCVGMSFLRLFVSDAVLGIVRLPEVIKEE